MVIEAWRKVLCGMGLGRKIEMQLHRCRVSGDKYSLYPVVTEFSCCFGLTLCPPQIHMFKP